MPNLLYIAVILVAVLVTGSPVFAQKTGNDDAVKWERYVAGEGKISVVMPGLPIAVKNGYLCSEVRSNVYAKYFENALYKLEVVTKGSGSDSRCKTIVKLNQATFEARLAELKGAKNTESFEPFGHQGYAGWRVSAPGTKKWLFGDLKKNRWIELTVNHSAGAKLDEARFIGSLDLLGKEPGKKIGGGAQSVLSQEPDHEPEIIDDSKKDADSDDGDTEGLVIFYKPIARYTDPARQNRTEGVVVLNVTFLANGTIGKITPVAALPDGLTETAITAARGIIFLPQRKNSKLATVTKKLKYSYEIY